MGLGDFNRALVGIPKRAEQQQADHLRLTFQDSGVAVALQVADHQVLYGRRGTGKTHALRYIETELREGGDAVAYIDLRTVGSPEGLFMGDQVRADQRVSRLLIDLLNQLHESLLEAALEDERLSVDAAFVDRLDAFLDAVNAVRVVGEVEVQRQDERELSKEGDASARVSVGTRPEFGGGASTKTGQRASSTRAETRRGQEAFRINFGDVARTLRELAQSFSGVRVWLLLDEWSSLPPSLQPLLAEFLVRCVLPLQAFSVKIAAIEQQSRFRGTLDDGLEVGIELGADVAANVDLDEFMVFEQNEARSRQFFLGLFFKHLAVPDDEGTQLVQADRDVIKQGFTDKRAFDELVRAAEGVPRDAINIAAKAALRAQEAKISVPDVRAAARSWYQSDKEAALRSKEESLALLNWVIDKVIRGKRARGFLVNQADSSEPLLQDLFDARVLHVVRRGYSAQDAPGERYNVYLIDYGAYVDLINTQNEPQGSFQLEDGGFVAVPTQDLRALRRAILELDEFKAERPAL